jgi:hypothetical protein
MEAEKQAKSKGETQTTLEFEKTKGPREFTRDGILDAVAKLIATDDEVS